MSGGIAIWALGVELGIASALIVLGGMVGALAGRKWGEVALFAIRTFFGLLYSSVHFRTVWPVAATRRMNVGT
jgi:hypothetical protein